jgi:hypothetical protein
MPTSERKKRVCGECGHPGHFAGTCLKYAGQPFNSWTVVRGAACPPGVAMSTYVLARCVCGVEKAVCLNHLRSGASKSCGCSRTLMASDAKAELPETVMVYGASLSLGELAMIAGRKPEYIWARMCRGMSAEKAAFGDKAEEPRAAVACREDADARRAMAALSQWVTQWGRLRGRADLAPVFEAIDGCGVTT